MPVPDPVRDLERQLARLPQGSPWRPVAAVRLRLAEAAEAERLRAEQRARRLRD